MEAGPVKITKSNLPAGPGPGRPKGIPNKATKAIKEMIIGALEDAGGQEYLTQLAKKNPVAFAGLLGKVIPMQVTGDAQNPVVLQIVQFAAARAIDAE